MQKIIVFQLEFKLLYTRSVPKVMRMLKKNLLNIHAITGTDHVYLIAQYTKFTCASCTRLDAARSLKM